MMLTTPPDTPIPQIPPQHLDILFGLLGPAGTTAEAAATTSTSGALILRDWLFMIFLFYFFGCCEWKNKWVLSNKAAMLLSSW